MNWDAVGAIGEWVGALAVVVTLAYLARQMSLNTRQLKRAELNATSANFAALRLAVAENGELAKALFAASTDFASLDPVSRFRVEQYCMEEFVSFHNFWDRIQTGDMDAKWDEFEGPVAYKFQLDYWRQLWPVFRMGTSVPEFKKAMERLAAQPPSPPSA